MASVTKTITETIGEVQQTTTFYFSSFEDFMEYERDGRVVDSDGEAPINILMEGGTQSANVKLGKEYKIVGNFKDHGFPIGTVVRVVPRPSTGEEYMAEYLDGHDWWWVYAQDLEEI